MHVRYWGLQPHDCDAKAQALRDKLEQAKTEFLHRLKHPRSGQLEQVRRECRLPLRGMAGLRGLKETPQNRAAIQAAKALFKDFQDCKRDRGLYLYGDLGTGKTTILAALAFDLRYWTGRCEAEGLDPRERHLVVDWGPKATVQFWPVPDWFTTMGRAISGKCEYDAHLVENCDALLLDDLGKQYDTAFKVTELFRVINYRYNECRSTSFTSNFSPMELGEKMASVLGDDYAVDVAAMIDRILETCTVVELKGGSWRRANPGASKTAPGG